MAELRKASDAALIFCTVHEVNILAIENLPLGSLLRLEQMNAAINALISPDPSRREFFDHERLFPMLYRALKPDSVALEPLGLVARLTALSISIGAKINPEPFDVSMVMDDIGEMLDAFHHRSDDADDVRRFAGFELAVYFFQACVEFVASEFGKSGDTQLRTQKLAEVKEVLEGWPKLSLELRAACLAVTRGAGAR